MRLPPPPGPADVPLTGRAVWQPPERLIIGLVLVAVIYSAGTSIWSASRKSFWFDEVFTVVLSEKPSLGAIVEALRQAADTSGPGYYWMQRSLRWTSADPHVAHRAASILSAFLAILAVFAFTRREFGALAGAVAVFFLLTSTLNHAYDIEARAYTPMVFGIATAMLAWQRADRWPWAVLLGIAAVFSVSVHYYAIFALAPFGAAELTRLYVTRRIRWRVWLALAAGVATLALLWPLLQAQRSYYGANYFSRPSIGKLLETYDVLSALGVNGAGLVMAVTVAVALGVVLVRGIAGRPIRHITSGPDVIVLVLGLVGLPFITGIVTSALQGGYTYRYALAVLPALAVGAGLVSRGISPRYHTWVMLLLLAAFGAKELVFWTSGSPTSVLRQPPPITGRTALMAEVQSLDLPLIIDDPHDYVPFAYYTRHRQLDAVGILEQQLALRRTGTDSIELDLQALDRHLPLRLQRFQAFCQATPRFLLLTRAGGADWKSDALIERGFLLTVAYRERPFTLYSVEAPRHLDRSSACNLDAARP